MLIREIRGRFLNSFWLRLAALRFGGLILLEIKNLTKVYDNKVLALDDVSFSVKPGQFLAVIGLSGSGKSTLLRCINRLIEPTAGQVIWNGIDVTAASQDEMRRIRRRFGMIFQHEAVYVLSGR